MLAQSSRARAHPWQDRAMREPLDRRGFLAGSGAMLAAAATRGQDGGPKVTHGPFLTFQKASGRGGTIELWARVSHAGEYRLYAEDPVFPDTVMEKAVAVPEDDLTLRWRFGIGREGPYQVRILDAHDVPIWSSAEPYLCKGKVPFHSPWSLVLGSCADDRKRADQPVWERIGALHPDLVVLLGDTPYIDSTDLEIQRARYRALYAQPQLAKLLATTDFVGTWDDHDYGGDNVFGAIEGREASRKAFLEYHGGGEWGSDGEGIYTRRSLETIDLFLLDTRWFADTEPSPFDASKRSLLGAKQWSWLQEGLRESKAHVKVLACGMVWGDHAGLHKTDAWRNWAHEREAFFEWLGRERISGVVLVGGDLHRSRAVRHSTKDTIGYDLIELVTSPLASDPVGGSPSASTFLFDAPLEHAFARISAERKEKGFAAALELCGGGGSWAWRLELGPGDLSRP
jgi:alkaline phosphatase D